MKPTKIPSSSQPASAPLATIAGSALDNTVNTNYLAYVSAAAAAAGLRVQQASDELDTGEEYVYEEEDDESSEKEIEGETGEENGDEDSSRKKNTPLLSDIQVVSNEVVYDASGNPTSKIVFKIKNSSGESLKAVNVKVEKK
jgi:hypothetical protein